MTRKYREIIYNLSSSGKLGSRPCETRANPGSRSKYYYRIIIKIFFVLIYLFLIHAITDFQLAEIKGQSRNENLYCKKGKTNAILRENYQIKLIQCYKLAINVTKVIKEKNYSGMIYFNILMNPSYARNQ